MAVDHISQVSEIKLWALTEDNEQLHEDNRDEETVNDDVPHTLHKPRQSEAQETTPYPFTYTTAFGLRHEDEHELVLVHPRADPEDDRRSDDYQRCKRGKEKADGAHEQLHKRLVQGEV